MLGLVLRLVSVSHVPSTHVHKGEEGLGAETSVSVSVSVGVSVNARVSFGVSDTASVRG